MRKELVKMRYYCAEGDHYDTAIVSNCHDDCPHANGPGGCDACPLYTEKERSDGLVIFVQESFRINVQERNIDQVTIFINGEERDIFEVCLEVLARSKKEELAKGYA